MRNKFLIFVFCLGLLLINVQTSVAQTKNDVLGLKVGMSREAADSRLQKIGKKDHDERKQQEIWKLKNDKRFSHVIVAFDKEYKKVRFVTAKARENGERVRYSDVLDTRKSVAQQMTNNHKYVLEIPAKGRTPGYKIIARGSDKDYLTYFAIEELDVIKQ